VKPFPAPEAMLHYIQGKSMQWRCYWKVSYVAAHSGRVLWAKKVNGKIYFLKEKV
jgi:hypothetical protein